jgi:hypothetical protein
MRKTVKIETLLRMVNYRNRNSTCEAEIRRGWNSLASEVLHNADVYAGFRYLDESEVPEKQPPGIIRDETPGGGITFPDDSRIKFFIHHSLKR